MSPEESYIDLLFVFFIIIHYLSLLCHILLFCKTAFNDGKSLINLHIYFSNPTNYFFDFISRPLVVILSPLLHIISQLSCPIPLQYMCLGSHDTNRKGFFFKLTNLVLLTQQPNCKHVTTSHALSSQ